MSFHRFALALTAALTLGAAALAADAPCPPRPMAMFTPEQRLMMFADMQAQADTGVDIQVLRQMQRDKMRAMTDEQRKAFADKLTQRWNALTPARQAEIKTAQEKWRAEHPRPEWAGRGGPDGRGPGGHGPRPDCPPPAH